MAEEKKLDALIQEKIDGDSDFQATLADMSEEDQAQAIADKKAELIEAEFVALNEQKEKADEIAKNQKIRAEKAEKATPKNAGETSKEEYSLKDILALRDVHGDDVDTLVEYAKFKKIPVAEAKKLPEMMSFTKDAEAKRKTESAKIMGGGKRPSSVKSGEAILEQAVEKNELSDDSIDDFVKARIEAKRRKKS